MAIEYDLREIHIRAVELGLSDDEIARRSGLTRQTVAAVMSGKLARRRTIHLIIKALDIAPSSIIKPLRSSQSERSNARAGVKSHARSREGRPCRKSA